MRPPTYSGVSPGRFQYSRYTSAPVRSSAGRGAEQKRPNAAAGGSSSCCTGMCCYVLVALLVLAAFQYRMFIMLPSDGHHPEILVIGKAGAFQRPPWHPLPRGEAGDAPVQRAIHKSRDFQTTHMESLRAIWRAPGAPPPGLVWRTVTEGSARTATPTSVSPVATPYPEVFKSPVDSIELNMPRAWDDELQAYDRLSFKSLDGIPADLWRAPATNTCSLWSGNGYTMRFDICAPAQWQKPKSDAVDKALPARLQHGVQSAITCWRNQHLTSSLCEMRNVQFDANGIKMADGGEDLDKVTGRIEQTEFAAYTSGAIKGANCFARPGFVIQNDQSITDHISLMFQAFKALPAPQLPADVSHAFSQPAPTDIKSVLLVDPRPIAGPPAAALLSQASDVSSSKQWQEEWPGLEGIKASQLGPTASKVDRHTLFDSIPNSPNLPPLGELPCDAWIDEPVLLVTRYEYANLYHTLTDWYNVFQTLKIFDLPVKETLIVLVDGHSKGLMDPVWPRMFGDRVRYFRHLVRLPPRPNPPQAPPPPGAHGVPGSSAGSAASPAQYESQRVQFLKDDDRWQKLNNNRRLCFARAYAVPPGYRSPLSVNYMSAEHAVCEKDKFVRDFFHHMLSSYNIPLMLPVPFTEARMRVLVVLRHDYNAHPRVGKRHASRRIINELEFVQAVRKFVPHSEVRTVSFEERTIYDQISLIRWADLLIGVHGAALSYAPLLAPHAGLFEVASVTYSVRVHFEWFCHYSGIAYAKLIVPDAPVEEEMIIPPAELEKPLQLFVEHLRGRLPSWGQVPELAARLVTLNVTLPARSTDVPKLAAVPRTLSVTPHDVAPIQHPIAPTPALPNPFVPHPELFAQHSDPPFLLPSRPPAKGHRLAVVVPFRDSPNPTSQGANRTKNLNEFVPSLWHHLTNAGRDFTIFIVEQTQGAIFNKGALFNVGYQLIRKDFDYLVLHDVDQLPEKPQNDYAWVEDPTHLCVSSQQWDYKESYEGMVGGAMLMQTEHYEAIDGMSNLYYGWGQEDDDLYLRLIGKFAAGGVKRLNKEIGRYRTLSHDRVKDLDVTPMFKWGRKHLEAEMRHAPRVQPDGASSVSYAVLHHQQSQMAERFLVELKLPFMPTSLNQTPPFEWK